MFQWRCLNFIQFAALAFLVPIFLGGIGHGVIGDDISTETVPGSTDGSIDGTGEVSSKGLSTNAGASIDSSGSLSGGSETTSGSDNAGDTDSSDGMVGNDDGIGGSGEGAGNISIGYSISEGTSSTGDAFIGIGSSTEKPGGESIDSSGSSSRGSEVVSGTYEVGDTSSSGGSSPDSSGSSSGESADASGNDEGSNKNSAIWNIITGDAGGNETGSSSGDGGWINKIIGSVIGIKTEQSPGGSNGVNQNMNNIIGNIIGSLSGQKDPDVSFGSTLGGIWEMITGNSDGNAKGNSSFHLDSIKNMKIQEMVSIIGRYIRNLPEETAADLTDEDVETIIRDVIESLGGGTINISGGASGDTGDTNSVRVETVGDLLTVLQKSSLSTLLDAIAEYLSEWKITVDNTKYGILDLVTMPQKELYKIIQYVIANFQDIVDSSARSVLGENFLVNTILGFGNKTIECVVSSAVDLPGVVGDDLVECVTGRVNEVIQLVIDAVQEIRSSLLLLRHIVDSVTGCSGLFCLGAATATTMSNGINLVIKIVGTVAHVAVFSGTLVEQLPGCFVGSVTLTPVEEIAKMIGRFGICMIP